METIRVKRALGTLTLNEKHIEDLLDNKPMLEAIILMLVRGEDTFENNWEVEFTKDDAMEYLKEYFLKETSYDKNMILQTFDK